MGNEVQEFDLHIEVGTSWYCGDISITCEVTYPGLGIQPAIKIDYDKGDESLEGAIALAVKDIAAYMEDPEEWIRDYVAHSSEDWRKLKEAQDAVSEYKRKIESEQRTLAHYQKWLQENEAKVAELQAKLIQE